MAGVPALLHALGSPGRGLRAPAYRQSWRWCRHSKGRRCRGAWWNYGLAISRAGGRRGGFPHSAVRPLRRFYGRGPSGLRPSCLACGRKRGRPPPPPDMAADPKPGMIAEARAPVFVKNHPFAVCAGGFLGSTIDSESSRAPLIPPLQGLATRLFSCPRLVRRFEFRSWGCFRTKLFAPVPGRQFSYVHHDNEPPTQYIRIR